MKILTQDYFYNLRDNLIKMELYYIFKYSFLVSVVNKNLYSKSLFQKLMIFWRQRLIYKIIVKHYFKTNIKF